MQFVHAGELVLPTSPQAHALPATDELPQVLAQLQSCSFTKQLPCSSLHSALPASCWSMRLCAEISPISGSPMLSQTPPFQHAFELLCSCILASSVDVIASLLPSVTDEPSLRQARGTVQTVLEEFLT